MAQGAPNRVGLALVFLFVLHLAQAVDKCKTGCDGSSGLLKLTPGTTYKYDYDGKIDISLSSAEAQQTSTEVKATVLLTQQADCSQVLRLQNVQVIGPDGKKRTGIPDVETPVVLNNNNGALGDFICSEPGDTQNSLNMKRAIASLFQVNEDKNSEVDVFGQCPTQIFKSQDGDILTITKNKNLNKCLFRESITNNYITSSFDVHSEIQSSPVLNSNLDSKQKIKGGVLDSASVIENYLFVPFSAGKNGAKATIESKLTLTGTSKDNPTTKCATPKSIIFENPHPVNVQKSNVNVILKKVKEISEQLGNNVERLTAIHFVDLIRLLRVSKKTDILSVYNQVRSGAGFPDKEAAKKIFLDAILLSGNGDTIEVAIELLKNKELDHMEEKQLYMGLSRARHATENSIKTATDLLNRPNLPREAFLGIGALTGRYCAAHSCDKVEVVNKIIQKLLSKLGDLKAASRKEESDMIYILKGLTNIGFLNDAIPAKLVSLAEDKKQPARLRVATLEAFQAAPCKDKFRDSALKTLKDIQQDSEIRIKAYLVLTRCPNEKIAQAIKTMLEGEKSNQVGGFISTHLKNLRSSSNPDKTLAKSQLGFIHAPNRFAFDPRKYSFNGEFSQSIDALGLGSNVEGNVIYSQNSWLPRSANLNLTAELFGQRLNFLEVAARQENLDRVIEHYLGPEGVLRKATLQQNWDNTVKPVEKLMKSLKEKVDKSLRARRDVSKAEIDEINKKVQIKSVALDRNLDLDLSIKNFGSEILFMSSFETIEKLTPQSIIDGLVGKLNEGLDKLKNFEKVLRSNLLLLDAELSYPTSLGFPLRLGVNGAANLQVKTSGNIDVRELMSDLFPPTKDLSLRLSLIPSATISVIGRFSLDTPLLENGLKVDSTLHTSSGGEVLVSFFKGGSGLDIKYSLPVQKQELIGLKHDIIFQTREQGVVLQNERLKFSQNKDLNICIDQLVEYIGLEFCSDLSGPNLSGKKVPVLPFPLSGDVTANVRVETGAINTFHYRREFFSSKEGKVGVQATLETLDKNNKKGVSLDLEGYISPEKYIKATLHSPIKNAEAEARLILNDKEKLLSLTLKDEDKVYSAKAGLTIEGGDAKTTYNPVFEYITPESKTPQTPPLHIEGKVILEKNGNDVKYTFDNVKLIVPGQKPITLTGSIGTDGPAYFSDLTASDGNLSGSAKGRIQAQPHLLKILLELKNTMNPDLNFNVNAEFKNQKNFELVSSNIQLAHGADLTSKKNLITLMNSFGVKNLKNLKDLEISTKNKFSYPLMKLNAKFDLDKTPKSLDYDTFLHYGEAKLGSELKLKLDSKTPGDYQLEFNVKDAKNKVELKSSRQVVGPDDSKIDNSLSVNDKKLEISGKVKHHLRPNDVHVAVDLVIKVPNGKAPWKLNKVVKVNNKEIDLHTKLISGSNPMIDTLFKANRVGTVNSHVKINFKDVLTINGQLKAQKGAGKGDITIESKALKKTAKAESTFTLNSPTYNFDLVIYPIFNEDKNKKLALSTKNKFTGSDLDSASTLDLLGSKFELNAKALLGSPLNGKTTVDVDLTLPTQQYFAAKLSNDVSHKDGLISGVNTVDLEQRDTKASPPRKLSYKGVSTNSNFKGGILDLTVSVAADDSAGHNMNVDGHVKKQKNGDKWNVDIGGKLTGSCFSNPIEMSFNSEYKKLAGNFNYKSSLSPKAVLQVNGNYDVNAQRNSPITADIKVDLATPIELLSSVKTSHSIAIKRPQGGPVSVEGSGSLQTVSSSESFNIDSKGNLKLQGNKNTGSLTYHGEINKPMKAALDLSGDFNINAEKKTGTAKGNFKVITPKNAVIQGSGSLSKVGEKEYKVESSLDLPLEKFKSNKLNLNYKRTEDNEIISNAELISDGQKRSLASNLKFNTKEPSANFKLTHPDGSNSELSADIKRPSDAKLIANVKASCHDFLMEAGLDINSESLSSFHIQASANCPKLNNVKNIFVKIGNDGSNDGKTLSVQITSAGKNIISGSANVSSREEQGKFIVEGSGKFKVENADKSGNFKYIRTSLTSDKNGETGEEISFDGTLGTKAIDAELKLTNKEFRYSNSYCEESKQCAHVEIDAKTSIGDLTRFQNQIEITVDLRVLGVPNEFGLKAVTNRQNWRLDHTVDVHFENAANKYQYSLYVHPKEVGISLTTPKRIIALEATADLPTANLRQGGKATGAIAFYTDKKNNPSSKSSLEGAINVDVEKRTIIGKMSLNTVGQTKPLTITYTRVAPKLELTTSGSQELILDVFAKPEQKIVISHTFSSVISKETYKVQGQSNIIVKSPGLGIDINCKEIVNIDPKAFTGTYEDSASINVGKNKYESIVKLALSTKEAYLMVKHLNLVLLEAKSDINLNKGLISINTHTSGLGLKPFETMLEIKNYNTLKFSQYLKSDPNSKLLISAGVVPGQIADARAEYQTGGAKKELFHASVKLDEKNFLQPDAGVRADNIREVSEKIKDVIVGLVKETAVQLDEGNKKLSEDFNSMVQGAKETIPDTSRTMQFYQSELDKLANELATDKTLQDFASLVKNMFNIIATTAARIINSVSEIVEKLVVILNNAFSNILKTVQTDILPKLKEIATQIITAVSGILDKVSDMVLALIVKCSEVVEVIHPHLQAIATTLSEITADFGRFVVKTLQNIRNSILDQLKHLRDELKASPMIANLKAKYKEFIENDLPSQEVIVNTMKAITGALREAVLVPDFQTVIDMIEKYLEKKLTNQPVDDVAEIEKISDTFVNAVTKFAAAVSHEVAPDVIRNFRIPSMNFDLLRRLPSGVGSFRVSALEYLMKEDTKPFVKFLIRLVLSPREFLIPTSFDAMVSEAIITFDEKIFHSPTGNCNYLLARDAVNGNFSAVASFSNKEFVGITYTDKYGTVTIEKDKVLFNHAPAEYPIHNGGLHVYRTFGIVYLESSVGVKVTCELYMIGCHLGVSGFYHGQLRGILGNANNEEFDDLTLPNGKIITSPAELSNAYNVGDCAAGAQAPPTSVEPKPNAGCEKVFSWDSSLRLCYPFVNPAKFEEACKYLAHGGYPDAHRMISSYYAFRCWNLNVPTKVPSEHAYSCTNSLVPHKDDEQFEVKLPGTSADVLFMVNTNKKNEGLYKEYVQPLVADLEKEFKAKGITDVNFQLIAFGGENRHGAHVTVNGKTSFKGQAPNLKFADHPKSQKLVTGYQELDVIIGWFRTVVHEVRLALGMFVSENALDVSSYPFRADAIRSVIVVSNEPFEDSVLLPLQLLREALMAKKEMHFNAIYPVKNLKVKDVKTTKDVIGFNSENVMTLAEAKTKPTGNPALQKDLSFNDPRLDYLLRVDGNVFVADNIIANKNSKQDIVQVIAKTVVNQALSKEITLDCTCGHSFAIPWYPYNRCSAIDVKEK